jgi:protein kinase X
MSGSIDNSFGGGSKDMTSAECEANAIVNRVPDLGIESPEDLECIKTVGTGTFGRVMLVRNKRHKMDTESARDHISQDKKPSIVPGRHGYYALKVLNISQVIKLRQVDHVKNEKNCLLEASNPFIVQLYWTYRDENYLYMLLEYVPGGELFTYLRNAHKFENDKALFYAAEIVSALAGLHEIDIIYRDMKPENVLIDTQGHVKLTDFGFAKKVKDRTWTLCGTPEYLAPEIIQSKGHGKAVDWWSLGILVYEMLAGFPPFFDENPFDIYRKILENRLEFPRHFESTARDLIKRLLVDDRTRRLGCLRNGSKDVKDHKWFSSRGFTWEDVYNRKLRPPIMPIVNHPGDHQNFEDFDDDEEFATDEATDEDRDKFKDF